MSDAAMPLSNQDLEQIKQHLSHWMDNKIQSGPWAIGPELLERAVRVEEELKHQRLLMRESFEQFEKRFEQVDKRFEQSINASSRSINALSKSINALSKSINASNKSSVTLIRSTSVSSRSISGLIYNSKKSV
jgi:hypothetical protein